MGLRSVSSALLIVALPAAAALAPPPGLNPRLLPPPDEIPAFALSGSGVHVYECRQSFVDPDKYVWSFVAPDATLYDGSREAARMTTPNLLESSADRTSVSGFVRTLQPAGGANLPWALMQARPVGEDGLFAGVTSIQRVNTRGGAAPPNGCDADNAGQEARVAYSADYYFYRKRGTS
ncbi:MAG: DUF3455 domain-containing protein [Usitatibacter sp.]